MSALRELIWLVRLANARLCQSACRSAIRREHIALERAMDAEHTARATLRAIEYERHADPVPRSLLRRKA